MFFMLFWHLQLLCTPHVFCCWRTLRSLARRKMALLKVLYILNTHLTENPTGRGGGGAKEDVLERGHLVGGEEAGRGVILMFIMLWQSTYSNGMWAVLSPLPELSIVCLTVTWLGMARCNGSISHSAQIFWSCKWPHWQAHEVDLCCIIWNPTVPDKHRHPCCQPPPQHHQQQLHVQVFQFDENNYEEYKVYNQ